MRQILQFFEIVRRERRPSVLLALFSVVLIGTVLIGWFAGAGVGVAWRAPVPTTTENSAVRAHTGSPSGVPLQPGQEDDIADDDSPRVPEAFRPTLLNDNANLSYARRAGLHRSANPLLLTASAVVLADRQTGEVLYARNDHAILPIASLTKLLAGIVILESKLPLDAPIRVTREDVDTLRHSRSRLRVGTTLTRREALRLALMSSENRAAHALARTFAGGIEAFVAAMNLRARALGMHDSSFMDPTGLSNRNRATARDVAKLVAAAAGYPLLRSYSTTSQRVVTFAQRKLSYLNSNRLVRAGWPIQLQKTGYIVEAGQCMAMALRVGGRDLVMVLLDSGSRASRQEDALRLRRWAANNAGHSSTGLALSDRASGGR